MKIKPSERPRSPAHFSFSSVFLLFTRFSVHVLTLAGESGPNGMNPWCFLFFFAPPSSPPTVSLRVDASGALRPSVLNSQPALELKRQAHRRKAPASPLTSRGVLPPGYFFPPCLKKSLLLFTTLRTRSPLSGDFTKGETRRRCSS